MKIALARRAGWSMADYSGDSVLMLTLTSASAATLGWSPYSYAKFVWCSKYEEASVTNWDLSTGQAGVNDRHCMYRRLGQARPCNATLTDARRWTCRLAGS